MKLPYFSLLILIATLFEPGMTLDWIDCCVGTYSSDLTLDDYADVPNRNYYHLQFYKDGNLHGMNAAGVVADAAYCGAPTFKDRLTSASTTPVQKLRMGISPRKDAIVDSNDDADPIKGICYENGAENIPVATIAWIYVFKMQDAYIYSMYNSTNVPVMGLGLLLSG
jgi:hypothetical protein